MKTATIEIGGVEYLAVFNNRVLTNMENAGIRMEDLQKEKPITNILKMLAFMIDAGNRYAAANKIGDYPSIDFDTLIDCTDQTDYPRFVEIISACMAGERQVDAIPGKKQDADQDEARTD